MSDSPRCPLTDLAVAYLPRLADVTAEPGLAAAVDQHAAAVCDTLVPAQRGPEGRTVGREELSDYVRGFTHGLSEAEWAEPAGHDFVTLRLTAVCWLIREHDLLDA